MYKLTDVRQTLPSVLSDVGLDTGGRSGRTGKDYALWDHSSDTTCGIIHSRI